MHSGTCDSRFLSLKGQFFRSFGDFSILNCLNLELYNRDTTVIETYVKWSGGYEWVNDFCNVIWLIIYKPQSSGDDQQVMGESTAVLKTITDNRSDRPNTEINFFVFVNLSIVTMALCFGSDPKLLSYLSHEN